jgi:hypothetical protein
MLSAGGVAGVGVGVAFGVRARLLDDESQRYCPTDPEVCTPAGAELRNDALTNERVAIVAIGAGAAMLAAGAVLLAIEWTDDGKRRKSGAVSATGDGVRFQW